MSDTSQVHISAVPRCFPTAVIPFYNGLVSGLTFFPSTVLVPCLRACFMSDSCVCPFLYQSRAAIPLEAYSLKCGFAPRSTPPTGLKPQWPAATMAGTCSTCTSIQWRRFLGHREFTAVDVLYNYIDYWRLLSSYHAYHNPGQFFDQQRKTKAISREIWPQAEQK